MSYFLGIDSSTTATKALVMDSNGAVVAVGRSEYGFNTPHPLWSEQSPELWWRGTCGAIADALGTGGVQPSEVVGVGLTGQMHGLVMLDADGQVLRDAILWNDQRTQAECDEIRELIGRERLIAITGNDALTGFTAPKILWVRNNEPAIYELTRHILLPKDYVRYRLTQEFATDKAGGSGTILFNLAERDWSGEIVDRMGIDRSWLPTAFEGPEVTGFVSREAAGATGLPEGVPVYAGGGDQAANAVGVGAVVPGLLAMSIGTSGVVFGATDHPAIEPDGRLHAFCHAAPGLWHLMGVMLSAAGSYGWFRDTIAPGTSFAELDRLAATVDAGSDGLVFLPYLSGERTPHPDPLARGAFIGLTVRHTMAHMARSVLEGVAMGLRECVELVRQAGAVGEIRASGGGAGSDLWVQIIADTIGSPISIVGTSEGAAHGAALIAAAGGGAFASVQEAAVGAVAIDRVVEPSERGDPADERAQIYSSLYPLLESSFKDLAGN